MKVTAHVQAATTRQVWSPTRRWRSAEMLEHELDRARSLQVSLFPSKISDFASIRLAAVNRPARIVSGDFYDALAVDAHRMAIVCADVSGKGFAAALLAAQVQSYFHAMLQAVSVIRTALESASHSVDVLSPLGSLPIQVMTQLNKTACRQTGLEGRYATIFFAEIDARDGAVHYVNAGHNPPLLLATGSVVELLSAGGPPVGLLPDATYEVGTVTVPADGALLIYTDGVIEATDRQDEEFGLPRLIELWAGASGDVTQRLPRIVDAVEAWRAGLDPVDDITLVAVGRETP